MAPVKFYNTTSVVPSYTDSYPFGYPIPNLNQNTNTKNIARFIYSNINYYGRYTVLKANGLYLGITSSDIYFMTLGYSSTVMAVPAVQFTGGLIVGYYGGDIFTPDFNTGNQAFDMGLQMGSLIYFYKKEFHINYYKKDSNEKKSSN